MAKADGILCSDGLNKFQVDAPKGWKIDSQMAKYLGVCVFYYPHETQLETSPAVIYVRLSTRGDIETKKLDEIIEEDLANLKIKSPVIYKNDKGIYKNKNKLEFRVVRFINGPKNQEFESNAYLKTKNSILVIALTSRTQVDFDNALPLWLESVNSTRPADTKTMIQLEKKSLAPKITSKVVLKKTKATPHQRQTSTLKIKKNKRK